MKLIKVKILLALIFILVFTGAYTQNQKGSKSKVSPVSSSVFRKAFESQIMQLGEPYISWLNNKSDKIPRNFAEQIANLKWPLEEDSEKSAQGITKEGHYKSVFQTIRKLKSGAIDPIWAVIANDTLNSMCGGGDFESGALNTAEWAGAWGNLLSGVNDPSMGTFTPGFLPTSGIDHPISSVSNCTNGLVSDLPLQNHHSIISASAGPDPTISSLQTTATSSSNFSFRIGNKCNGYGADILAKKFIVGGTGIVKFSYALVLEGPHGLTDNPSFWVKVFDNVGNLIPGVVYLDATSTSPMDHIVSMSTDPFFQHTPTGVNFRDWSCAKIDLSKYIGQTISVALINTDCAAGGHFGYGYIDNWCGNCEGTTTGTVNIIVDSCITKNTHITANYTLPTIGTTTGSATITLIFYHNGIATGYTIISPVLTINGSYSFVVDPNSIPCNGSGYDVVARADFTILSSSYSLYSPDPMTTDGIKPGQNNDLVCCETLGQICDSTDVRMTSDSGCCYLVEISNKYSSNYFTGISIKSDNLTIANLSVSPGNTWSTIAFQNTNQVVFSKTSISNGIPLDGLTGFQPLGTICFAGTGPSNITVNFIGPPPKYDTICPKNFNIECSTPIDTTCAAPIDLKAECNAGAVKMKFRIKNNSGFTMRGLTLYSQTPGVIPSPKFIPIPDLLPGQVSLLYYETTLIVSNNATNACFFISACDQNTQPGDHGQYPKNCCMDSIHYCVNIPHCDPCDGISFTKKKKDPVKCCYSLSLTSNYYNANIKYLEFDGIGGTQFALFTGWSIIGYVSSNHIKIEAPGGGIPPGTYADFASFCLTGTSTPPHTVLINSIDAKGVHLCTDTLKFDSCQLVTPTCANIINDSLYCSGNKVKYTFYVKNNAPFTLYQIDFRTTDKSVVLDSNYTQPHPPITTGNTGGPFTVTLDSVGKNLDRFCMYLTGHNAIYDSVHGIAATECCTDSLGVICLPMIKCGSSDTTGCCEFANMTIPNGITPNDDGINDVFEILNSKICDYISIKVYNRWGNMVYQNGDYKNDWKGVNNSGKKLVQGTYFILLELPNGNKKGTYVDIRY